MRTNTDSRSMATSGRGSGIVGYNVQVAVAGTATLSQHAYGRAIDFLPSKGHSKQQIVAWLMAHRDEGWVSGIMTYATMSHIHVDTGPYHFGALKAR